VSVVGALCAPPTWARVVVVNAMTHARTTATRIRFIG
jgi:hypothetical protein